MKNLNLSFDEQLIICLSGFQSASQSDNKDEEEEKAFELLEQIQQEVAVAPTEIGLAKWGCLLECLVQNSFIEAEVDELLAETDTFLSDLWQKMDIAYVDVSPSFLWLGDYFLFRSHNRQSQFRFQSFKVLEQMLLCLENVFCNSEHSVVYVEPIFFFPTDVWQDVEWWLLRIGELNICELSEKVLTNLYVLRETQTLLRSNSPKNILRWQLRNSCFLNNSSRL